MDPESPLPDKLRAIARPSGILFVIALTSALFRFWNFLHWLIALYSALLLTPLLTCFWFRMVAVRRIGFRRLAWPDSKRLYGWTLLVIVSLTVFLYSLELWRGKWAYARLQKEVQQQGGSLDLASIIPPPVPDAENFCATPLLAALVDFPEDSPWFLGTVEPKPSPDLDRVRAIVPSWVRRNDRNAWTRAELTDFEARRDTMLLYTNQFGRMCSTNSAVAEIRKALTIFDPPLSELREAMNRPRSRWNLPFESGWFVEIKTGPRNIARRALIEVLNLRSVTYLASGNLDAALADVELSLRLADTLRGEPSFFSFAGRIELLRESLGPIWEGMARRQWSPDSLKRLQQRLEGFQLIADAKQQSKGGSLIWMSFCREIDESLSIRNLLAHREQLLASDRAPMLWVGLAWKLHPTGWTYQNEVYAYRWFDPATREATYLQTPVDPFNCFYFRPKLEETTRMISEIVPLLHLSIQQGRVACALERYFLKHNSYPEQLSDLAPDWIARIPVAGDSTKPLLGYRKSSNGRFLLYPATMTDVPEEYRPLDTETRSQRRQEEFGDSVWRYPVRQEPPAKPEA